MRAEDEIGFRSCCLLLFEKALPPPSGVLYRTSQATGELSVYYIESELQEGARTIFFK